MVLRTARLILCVWDSADWSALRPIATDPEVMRYITGGTPWSDEQIRSFVRRQVDLYRDRGFCRWKLIDNASGDVAGFCGVGFWHDAADPEIGWWLARRYWGRGLATEAATEALQDAFERVRLERIISVAMPENRASTRIMEKLGFEFESEFENEGVRLVQYAIDRGCVDRHARVLWQDAEKRSKSFSRRSTPIENKTTHPRSSVSICGSFAFSSILPARGLKYHVSFPCCRKNI